MLHLHIVATKLKQLEVALVKYYYHGLEIVKQLDPLLAEGGSVGEV